VAAAEPVAEASGPRPWEIAAALGIGALACWLRLRHLDLIEFKTDEATAVSLARRLLDGNLLSVGLRSSVGAYNPPLFVYLTAVPLVVRDDPLAAAAFVGVLATAAVTLTYVVLRPRFGALVALGAAALFAAAPWSVLYGRKLWGQSVLPLVATAFLWSMFTVLERPRTRAVALIPVLLCLALQLNFSALALVIPGTVLLLYRVRELHWPALALGVGAAALLLAPWLYHEATNGFTDISLLSGAPEDGDDPRPFEAVRESLRLVGTDDWDYVAAGSLPAFVTDAGLAGKAARYASVAAAAFLVLGLVTCVICVVRSVRTAQRWPWFVIAPRVASRALLLVWLGGVWFTISGADHLYPHYLIATFPVIFAVQALGLTDLVGAVRRVRRPATVGAIALLVGVVTAFTAFTLSFQRFLDESGGAAGDYGVVYRDRAELASVLQARGLRAADEPAT
jgi:4-amino-4-deoxy-L-arabinose transferase-like glycosyltransferase